MNRLCRLILNDLSYGVTDWVYEGNICFGCRGHKLNVAQGRTQHLCLNQVQQIDHMSPKIKFKNCFVIPLISNPRIISTIYVV